MGEQRPQGAATPTRFYVYSHAALAPKPGETITLRCGCSAVVETTYACHGAIERRKLVVVAEDCTHG